jgi:hypothetical protein
MPTLHSLQKEGVVNQHIKSHNSVVNAIEQAPDWFGFQICNEPLSAADAMFRYVSYTLPRD